MRIPESLVTLHDQGIISEVLRPLMSGKEAQIYLVDMGDRLSVAKVYKEAQNRSFKQRADYTEGRKVRNSRDQRAMAKRTKHGREQEEAAWRSTEVDVIYRLHAGGVRVPIPYHFIDGVLVMELIADANGDPAPRLGDLAFTPEVATRVYQRLIREVMRMLCVGIVHGDLSDFNVLLGADGPVIIDFPQSVDTAHNNNARQLLVRDVENLHRFLARFVPNARRLPYAEEMWELHKKNALTPDTQLTGRYQSARRNVDLKDVLGLIGDANYDERKRRDALGLKGGPAESPQHAGRPHDSRQRPQNQGERQRPQHQSERPQPQAQNQSERQRPQNQGERPQNQSAERSRAPYPQPRGPRHADIPVVTLRRGLPAAGSSARPAATQPSLTRRDPTPPEQYRPRPGAERSGPSPGPAAARQPARSGPAASVAAREGPPRASAGRHGADSPQDGGADGPRRRRRR